MGNGQLTKIEKALFQLLVLFLPTQLGFHFWPEWAFVYGIRVDYFSPTIYLTDVLLVFLLVLFFWNKLKTQSARTRKSRFITYLFFGIYVFFNVYFSKNWQVALVKWGRVLEIFLFGYYVVAQKNLNLRKLAAKPLTIGLIALSLIAVGQFVLQKTIGGFFYYLGERSFKVSTPGIALVNLFGKDYMRAYSTFSHPNSLAGYASVVLILLWIIKEKTTKLNAFSVLVGIAILLSFSKGALISWLILLIIKIFSQKGFLRKNAFSKLFLLTVIFISLISPMLNKEIKNRTFIPENILMRANLSETAGQLISRHPTVGVGLNNFIENSHTRALNKSFSWDLQPVHNTFLLVFVEAGLVGLILSFFVFWKALETKMFTTPLLFILFTGVFDHYWLTLQQNLLLLSLVLGFAIRKK